MTEKRIVKMDTPKTVWMNGEAIPARVVTYSDGTTGIVPLSKLV